MASLPEIDEQKCTTPVKSEIQSEQQLFEESLSEERLSPSLVAEDIQESKDLLLKLEVDEAFDDINDEKYDTEVQCGNDDEASNEDQDVSIKIEQPDAPGYDIYKDITDEQREAARKNNECFICKKRFSRFSTFKRHMKRHTGVKNYKCHICSKAFAEGSYLKAHLITHSGATPYGCKICQKRFTQSSSLHSHIKIHTGEKRYRCDVCSKAFTGKSVASVFGYYESSTLRKHIDGKTLKGCI